MVAWPSFRRICRWFITISDLLVVTQKGDETACSHLADDPALVRSIVECVCIGTDRRLITRLDKAVATCIGVCMIHPVVHAALGEERETVQSHWPRKHLREESYGCESSRRVTQSKFRSKTHEKIEVDEDRLMARHWRALATC